VQRVIKKVEPHDSIERYTKLGVEVITGEAMIRSPYEVEVNGDILTTRNIVIATGARPLIPNIDGIEDIDYLTSDTIWALRERPKKLLVLGGGPIGSELAQSFHRLGSDVTIVERNERILSREDNEVAVMAMNSFRNDGITLLTSHRARQFITEAGRNFLICENQGNEVKVEFDQVLVALGRKANVSDFGLGELDVHINDRGTIEADSFLRTNYPNIYVCGDVTGPYQFTHTAAHQAWYVAVNALFSPFKKFKVNYSVIPWATYIDPEVARVGLNEREAKAKNIPYEVTTYGIDDLDRAI
jgi:pyruvate/2-oxoglutarate dehydrogenase complex dihydrolipoamide dehydrogenase (E3) component